MQRFPSFQTPLLFTAGLLSLSASATAQISFTAGGNVPTGARADGPAFADLDNDGFTDLAVVTDGAGNQDLIEVFRGDGTGTFAPAGVVFLPNNSSPKDVAAADVDGDGFTDLVVILENFGQVAVARNLGAMSFVAGAGTPTGGVESRILEVGNMNGDALPDFVVSSRDSNNVSVLINNGGTLALAGTTSAGIEPRDIAVGDFNGDGLDDVAVAAHDSRQVVILRNGGGGALLPSQTLVVPGGTRPSGMAAADMDGDGDLDVIAGTGDDDNAFQNFVSIYTNVAGTFSGPSLFPSGGLDAGDVLAADLDLDGDVDVVVANETSGSVMTLENLGGGALGAPQMLAAFAQPDVIEGGDIDGNGSVDLGITQRQSPGVSIFLNDATGGPGTIGTNYCMANANSSGARAVMSATGSANVAMNNLTLISSSMPAGTNGYFLVSRSPGFVAGPSGSAGNLCLGGQIGRYSNTVLNSGAAGEVALTIDLTSIPTPTGFVAGVASETWYFQCWFRDASLGSPTSNFSDGYAVTLN